MLDLPKGVADAVSFLAVAAIGFLCVSVILSILRKKYIDIEFPKIVDYVGGAIFGTLSFFFIASFAVSLLLSFPTSAVIRDTIRDSVAGRFLLQRCHITIAIRYVQCCRRSSSERVRKAK